MALSLSIAVLVAVASCLALFPASCRGKRSPAEGECWISRYARLPPSELQPFVKLRRILGSNPTTGHRRVLVSSEQLRRLEVPERLLLVEAEFRLFVELMRELEESAEVSASGPTRHVLQTLHQIRRNLSRCIPETLRDQTKYSKHLTKLLRTLNRAGKSLTVKSAMDKVATDILLLLNEHLGCVAKGEDC